MEELLPLERKKRVNIFLLTLLIFFLTGGLLWFILSPRFTQQKPSPTPPFARRVGTVETHGVVFHNLGSRVGISISDEALFKETVVPLVKRYKPRGIEFFIYNDKENPRSINPVGLFGEERLKSRLQNFTSWFYYLSASTLFFGDTTVLVGVRPEDGVTEVHLGLFLKPGAHPPAYELLKTSRDLESDILVRSIVENENLGNPDVIAAARAMARYEEERKNSMLILRVNKDR